MPSPRRFPPPWSTDELTEKFVFKDTTGQAISYLLLRGRATAAGVDATAVARRGAARCRQRRQAAGTFANTPRRTLGRVSQFLRATGPPLNLNATPTRISLIGLLFPASAEIRWDINERRSREVGVSVFNAPEDFVGEGVVDPGASCPTLGAVAARSDEWRCADERIEG